MKQKHKIVNIPEFWVYDHRQKKFHILKAPAIDTLDKGIYTSLLKRQRRKKSEVKK